jgi:quaternary ammonium compound-resistance protein SugE
VAWIYLLLAGLFEVGFTTCIHFMRGTKSWWPEIGFTACVIASFSFLTLALQTIPIGTGYAVWTGIGAAGTVIVGIWIFGEATTTSRLMFLTLLIGSIVGLKLVS